MHRSISSATFPYDVLLGAVVALLICASGVWRASWFYTPLGATALLACLLILHTWQRRRSRTHDPPTIVAAACVAAAFLVAFAVLCELFAQIEQVRGYGIAQPAAAGYEAQPLACLRVLREPLLRKEISLEPGGYRMQNFHAIARCAATR